MTPCTLAIFVQSSRELAGRRMRMGYSELLTGMTRAEGPPPSAENEKTAAANSAQVAAPLPAMWKIP